MNNVTRLSPKLTANRLFINDLMEDSIPTPSFAMGVIVENEKTCGFLALKADKQIPVEVTSRGFNLGHGILGTDDYKVAQFSFQLYDYEIFHAIINPSNPIAHHVLSAMIEHSAYHFFIINPDKSVISYRSEFGADDASNIKTNWPQIKNSQTSNTEYNEALRQFSNDPQPPGVMLDWVCRDNLEYLDIQKHPLELAPMT